MMKTIEMKLVYSESAPVSKDVIWAKKTVNGIEFKLHGNAGWTTVAKENIVKLIENSVTQAVEQSNNYTDDVIQEVTSSLGGVQFKIEESVLKVSLDEGTTWLTVVTS